MALSKREELELLMLEKEKRRRASAAKSEEVHADIAERAGKFFQPPDIKGAAVAAAQGATLGFADELAGKWAQLMKDKGDKRSSEEIYEQARNEFRDETKMVREKSPFFSFVIENMSGLAPTKALKIFPVIGRMMKNEGLLATGVESALIGAGEAEEAVGTTAAVTGVTGIGAQILGRLGKTPFKRPERIRARAMGAKKEQFKHLRKYRDPEVTAKELRDVGFFSRGGRRFDIGQRKFVKDRKGSKIGTETALEDLQLRAEEADSAIWKRKEEILNKYAVKKKYTHADMVGDERLLDAFDEYITNSRDKKLAAKHVDQIEKELEQSISNPVEFEETVEGVTESFTEYQGSSLVEVEKAKQIYQQAASRIYKKSTNEGEIAKADLYDSVAKYLKRFVEENTGVKSAEFGRLNKISSRLKLAKGDLQDEIAARAGQGTRTPIGFSVPYTAARALENVGISPSGAMTRATVGEFFEGIPGQEQVQSMMRQTPARMMTRMLEQDSGRRPQSIPEQLVRKKFPRTSQAIVENKDLILAKIAQQAPPMFDMVQEVLEHRPEDIPEIMPVLTQMAGALFERDKYNRFDGIIHDPAMKEEARRDTMKNDSLSNTDKIEIINRLNKTGEYPL